MTRREAHELLFAMRLDTAETAGHIEQRATRFRQPATLRRSLGAVSLNAMSSRQHGASSSATCVSKR
jgi:hypothetical protein